VSLPPHSLCACHIVITDCRKLKIMWLLSSGTFFVPDFVKISSLV